jgi:hypothetical protein
MSKIADNVMVIAVKKELTAVHLFLDRTLFLGDENRKKEISKSRNQEREVIWSASSTKMKAQSRM